ncbi:porin family protein [Porifericola rhodea]|uniref:porin family protein n=1 Tax=Porifericola rhodea TaxID=930972 RepID=UPI002665FC4A|nr:porin family protein [Porifericola rhodea]WKN31204.1 porin family protein [Porifericola rhodea]
MKKLLFFIFLLHFHFSGAQILRVGPKVGIQASRAYYDNKDYYDVMTSQYDLGFHAGLVSNVKVSDLISLEAEILFNRVTKRLSGVGSDNFNQEKYNMLSVPLLLRVSKKLGYKEFYFNAGPNISYWLGGKGVLRTSELLEANLQELKYDINFYEINDEVANDLYVFSLTEPNRVLLGIDVGVGALLPIGRNHLMFDLRYSFGHTNMAKPDTQYIEISTFESDMNYSNHVISLSCAYLIDFDLFTMRTKGKSVGKKKN